MIMWKTEHLRRKIQEYCGYFVTWNRTLLKLFFRSKITSSALYYLLCFFIRKNCPICYLFYWGMLQAWFKNTSDAVKIIREVKKRRLYSNVYKNVKKCIKKYCSISGKS